MLDAVTSRTGIRRLRTGNPILSVLEAAAQSDVRSSADVFRLLRARDLDTAQGIALDRVGQDEDVVRLRPVKASGLVTLSDTSFQKIATTITPATFAPIAGSDVVHVAAATDFTPTGEVYLGRGTPNAEGPLPYSSVADLGAYWEIVLTTPTTRFHNHGESVILAQGGNRVVTRGTVVATDQTSTATSVRFELTGDVLLADGEDTLVSVQVTCTTPGTTGNVPAEAVTHFDAAPFPGGVATNPLPFTSGRDVESDDAYRTRIKRVRNSRQRGTDLAIENAVLGARGDDSATCTGAQLIRRPARPALLVVDDGAGYEMTTAGVGLETLADSALGGERDFEILHKPVVKAECPALETGPYPLVDSMRLAFTVGGTTTIHTFDAERYVEIAAATTYEVAAEVNSNPDLNWSMRTIGHGTGVTVYARDEVNDDVVNATIDAPEVDAAPIFGFPAAAAYTTLLYKNDVLLTKDGLPAQISSLAFAEWQAISGSHTLVLSVDSTPAVTYTFTDQHFVDAGTSFTGVGRNTPQAWCDVFEFVIPGITATVEGDHVVLTSNLGRDDRASLAITGGTLIGADFFALSTATGADSDYSLDRGTGQVYLHDVLAPRDRLTLGSTAPRGHLDTNTLAVTDLADDVELTFAVDSSSENIAHGVGPATVVDGTVIAVTPSGFHLQLGVTGLTGDADPFENVEVGDWLVVDDPGAPEPWQGRRRVIDKVNTTVGPDTTWGVVVEDRQMSAGRFHHALATTPGVGVLPLVVVTGGYTSGWRQVAGTTMGDAVTDRVEIYDPNTGTWSETGAMITARAHHTATGLVSGDVLVTGGYNAAGAALATTEIWSATTGLWTAGPAMALTRAEHTATLLGSGKVLVAGGVGTGLANSVEYNPGSNTFINSQTLVTGRRGHSAVLLPAGAGTAGAEAGNVLIAGGFSSATVATATANVERYNSGTPGWSAKTAMPSVRTWFGLAIQATQKVIAVGRGMDSATDQNTYAVYTVDTNAWSANTALDGVTATSYIDGRDGLASFGGNVYAFSCYKAAINPVRVNRVWNGTTWADYGAGLRGDLGILQTCFKTVALSTTRYFTVGGLNRNLDFTLATGYGVPIATHESGTAADPDYPAVSAVTGGLFPARGIHFIRSANALLSATVPAATGYTAVTFAESLVADLALGGAAALTYRTSKLRVTTSGFGPGTDIMLVGNTSPDEIPLPELVRADTQVSSYGFAVSGNPDTGTPHLLRIFPALGTTPGEATGMSSGVFVDHNGWDYGISTAELPHLSTRVLGGRRAAGGLNPQWWALPGTDHIQSEFGDAKDEVTTTGGVVDQTDRFLLRQREAFRWPASAPLMLCSPYSITATDDLTVVVDATVPEGRFVTPMYRKAKTVGAYGSTITLRDHDAADQPFPDTFGADYDWLDFMVLTPARVKSHPADASRRLLWRYYRHGKEGERVTVRYTYPTTPDSDLTVTTTTDQTGVSEQGATGEIRAFANVQLASGAAKTNHRVRSTTQLGFARTNGSTTTDVWDFYLFTGFKVVDALRAVAGTDTRLRLEMPQGTTTGPQDTGITVGMVLWFEATSPTGALYSRNFTVTNVNPFNGGTGRQDIFAQAGDLDDGVSTFTGANPGTVSFDSRGEATWDPSIVAGDLVTVASIQPNTGGAAARVIEVGPQYLRTRSLDVNEAGAVTNVQVYTPADPTTEVTGMAAPTQTAASIATATQAMVASGVDTAAVSATVTGTGSGVIQYASWDELGSASAGYALADGVNSVQSVASTTDTDFVLKRPVTSALTTNSDWGNEDVRLVPVTAKSVAGWLNTPSVTGLWTAAEVSVAGRGRRIQIATKTPGTAGSVDVQDGDANDATAAVVGSADLVEGRGDRPDTCEVVVRRGESAGFQADAWVRVESADSSAKTEWWNSSTSLESLDTAGLWTFDIYPYTKLQEIADAVVVIERVGKLVAVRMPRQANEIALTEPQTQEDGYIYLWSEASAGTDLAGISSANCGVFRIVRATHTLDEVVVWIENPVAIDETVEARVKTLSANSMVPGDTWAVNSDQFGVDNRRTWTITSVAQTSDASDTAVDEMFVVNQRYMRVDTTTTATAAVTSPTVFGSVVLQLRTPATPLWKRVMTINPDPDDGTYAVMQFDTSAGYAKINATTGSVVTAMDKLDFPQGVQRGVDAYRYATGLVGEAARIVRGDREDEATYPGYGAAGAAIVVSGPVVRRVRVALAIRVSGNPSEELADRVRSAVAAAINSAAVGRGVAISDVVDAAAAVSGVTAVSVIYPTYSSTSDLIAVAPGERPMVLDLRADVEISFVGTDL